MIALLLTFFIQKNPHISYCPNPICGQIITSRPTITFCGQQTISSIPIECSCGIFVCLNCKSESHEPLTCRNFRLFNENNKHEKSRGWMNKNTKDCPSCFAPIEKNGGCKSIRCKKCNHLFCWNCLQVFENNKHSFMGDCLPQYLNNHTVTTEVDINHQKETTKNINDVQRLIDKMDKVRVKNNKQLIFTTISL